jgi:SAM-dependent methyltransferase
MPSSDEPGRIEEIEKLMIDVFQGLKMTPGSICRIASKYLANWGVAVTDGNRAEIERRSTAGYLQDWQGESTQLHEAIENAIDKAGLSAGNRDMNGVLATMAVPIIGEMLKSHPEGLDILDVGAGNGDTTITLLNTMALRADTEELAKRCHFYLLEPSYRKAHTLGQGLETHPLQPKSTIVISSLEDHLPSVQDGYFHMTISNAVLHHLSSPAYLRSIHRKLADDGVLMVGDWYTTVWSRPELFVPILRGLGAAECGIKRFENYFGVRKEQDRLTDEQRKANTCMVDYIRCLDAELQIVTDGSKQQLFEAHQALPDHHADVKKAGFELDIAELKTKHSAFVKCSSNVAKLYPDMDIACVWAAAKIPKKNMALVKTAPRT